MTTRTDPPVAAETDRASAPESVIWQHAAFCRLGLPVSPGTEAWRRDGRDAALRMAPAHAGDTLPDGPGLRLLLAFLCDSALRSGSPTVPLGADAAALAARLGLGEGAVAPLAEQVERMLTARIVAAVEEGPELSVLDARSRPRGGAWPTSVKLNARFTASLSENAVALDRAILRALSASAEAMDAHAWTREVLSRGGADAVVSAAWPELMGRFGAPGADAAAFRDAFKSALRLVFEADLTIELAVDDEGVSVRHARPAAPAPAPSPAPAPLPAPVPTPAPEPAAAPQEAPRSVPIQAAPPPQPEAPQQVRPRDDRPRDDRPREDRPREDRPREERPREDRPRDERPRDDRPRDERLREERRPRRDELPDQGSADQISDDMIRLRSHLTGLPQVVWLRRGHGDENILVGVTPGARMDTDRLTILMVEPIIMQVSGGLGQGDFDRVSAWVMANRDLIDDFWEGDIASAEEVNRRVRKAPGPTFR